jgi:hypothetical protein
LSLSPKAEGFDDEPSSFIVLLASAAATQQLQHLTHHGRTLVPSKQHWQTIL